MKLIYIKSTITPKDYSVVREILKKERGEKLAPFIYKLSKLDSLEKYLNKENINYEVYQLIKTSQDDEPPLSQSYFSELLKVIEPISPFLSQWLEKINELVIEKLSWKKPEINFSPYITNSRRYTRNYVEYFSENGKKAPFSLVVWKKQINFYLNLSNFNDASSNLANSLKKYSAIPKTKTHWVEGNWYFKIKNGSDLQKLKEFIQEYKKQLSENSEIFK